MIDPVGLYFNDCKKIWIKVIHIVYFLLLIKLKSYEE